MISSDLNALFQKALGFAKDQRHEYLTIEYVFFALLTYSDIANLLNLPKYAAAAKCLRDYAYFNLVRFSSDVPLVLQVVDPYAN